MNDLFKCNSLDDIKRWLEKADDNALLAEFKKLKNYQNAAEWNQLVLACEAITMRGWDTPPFNTHEPVEADCYKGMSGSWETVLRNASSDKLAGSWQDWSKNGDSFKIYKGADTQNYGVTKLNSQRIPLPTNPFKIRRYIANCQQSALPFVAQIEQLNAMLDANMQPKQYGDDFYCTYIYCSFSNHDDVHETVRTEYFHHESDIYPDCQSDYIRVVPHIEFGKLSVARDRLRWRVEIKFTRAWGEMPLTQQKQAFTADLQAIFTEFEARITKKKLNYKAKLATVDAMQIVLNWLNA